MGTRTHKEFNMFLPAIAEKLRKQTQNSTENRLELSNYNEQHIKEENKKTNIETVIYIQIF